MPRRGFVHYATFPDARSSTGLVESLATVVEHGFEVVECSSLLDAGGLREASQFLARHGVDLYLSAGPEFVRSSLSLCDLNAEARRHSVDRALELIELAATLGAKNVMLVSGSDPGAQHRTAATEHLIESLRRVADKARTHDIPVTIETFPRTRPPGQLLGPTPDALGALERVGASEIGLTIDLSHLVQLGEQVAASAMDLAARSRHVHLSTCVLAPGHPLDGDQHPSFGEPGIALPLRAAALALAPLADRIDVVSVEIRRHHGEAADEFVRECASSWMTAMGE